MLMCCIKEDIRVSRMENVGILEASLLLFQGVYPWTNCRLGEMDLPAATFPMNFTGVRRSSRPCFLILLQPSSFQPLESEQRVYLLR